MKRSRSHPSSVRVAVVQMRCGADPADNLRRAGLKIARAARRGAQIVCLQELFRSRYFCQRQDHKAFRLAEPIPGPTTQALSDLARRHQVVIVGSLFERRAAGVYHNTAVILDADGRLIGRYRKMHIPDDPLFFEKFYFAPGDLGFPVHPTRYGKIGVLVCWDQWFPEAARLTALAGAQIIFYPTAIGWIPKEPPAVARAQKESWELVQRSHAVTNGVFVAVANRVGREDRLKFWGGSFIVDPSGRILGRAGQTSEEILMATCRLADVETQRHQWPFIRDRRVDAYRGLLERALS